ncbi:cupin domain-containing protein [Tautonia sociabilis]|uniref:Cupin domain-containing protein n=1 Tax=Tautonia sociabilis TaxID=2080755 RepID=A0A432MLN0_9BACT|nr:cupin domain-containing protein [Tautonia sociabilis]RUL88190.1 cupin domain-containing protein [Tautonia sociabilis]
MGATFTFLADLLQEAEPPADGILSRTIHQDERSKFVLFGFGPGQEPSEHTATMPAALRFLSGRATVRLGIASKEAGPGTFVHMPAGLAHAIRAEEPTVMLLVLFKG